MKAFIPAALSVIMTVSCSQVPKAFNERQERLSDTELFSIFDNGQMSRSERSSMQFLYSYMPLGDLMDHDGAFYLDNVRASLKAAEELPWGKEVPEREFRHFVLPVRVNNENLDSSRGIFYEELKDRVMGLSMADAALEVNHWCHEKVTYIPTDSRTSSPLAAIKSAQGRCGEESTLLVAALRSVCIPARQVYTPRWAHTDDNHAWVEAWIEGQWYFMGACEPEAVLNLGWFNSPASRGMLMNTNAFGAYDGPEEKLASNSCYTTINTVGTYAPTHQSIVKVVDSSNKPVKGIVVEYKLYNYAEFYTIASKVTDKDGKTTLTTGCGDLVAFASDGQNFGFARIEGYAAGTEDVECTLVLDREAGDEFNIQYEITPPSESATLPYVSDEEKARNNQRLAQEDAIRNAYVASFQKVDGLDCRGNWQTISAFLDNAGDRRDEALAFLKVLSAKDLRDVEMSTLLDHFLNAPASNLTGRADFEYVSSPRIANEMIMPFRQEILSGERIPSDSPESIASWCRENVSVDDDLNPMGYSILPISVWRHRHSDTRSLGIFFVALCRTYGWPARIDGVTGKVQYMSAVGEWTDVYFGSDAASAIAPSGELRMSYSQSGNIDNPRYYTHFTLSSWGDKTWNLLSYDEGEDGFEEGCSWAGTFRNGTTMDEGYYLLTTGRRLADGGVLATLAGLNVKEGSSTETELKLRFDESKISVLGDFNSEDIYQPADISTKSASGARTSLLSTTGRGYYVLGLLAPGTEPTNHALRDISAMREKLEQWGRPIVLLFDSESSLKTFKPEEFPSLPTTVRFGLQDGDIADEIASNLKLGNPALPVFIIADTFNRVVFVSEGYTVGLGNTLLGVIERL